MPHVSMLARESRALLAAMMLIATHDTCLGLRWKQRFRKRAPGLGRRAAGSPAAASAAATIEGVATPTSVAVVTATNAQ